MISRGWGAKQKANSDECSDSGRPAEQPKGKAQDRTDSQRAPVKLRTLKNAITNCDRSMETAANDRHYWYLSKAQRAGQLKHGMVATFKSKDPASRLSRFHSARLVPTVDERERESTRSGTEVLCHAIALACISTVDSSSCSCSCRPQSPGTPAATDRFAAAAFVESLGITGASCNCAVAPGECIESAAFELQIASAATPTPIAASLSPLSLIRILRPVASAVPLLTRSLA